MASSSSSSSRRERRQLAESIHPLSGVHGFAERVFYENRNNEFSKVRGGRYLNETEEGGDKEDSHLKEADFPKDMDIDFGPVDLSFARQAYRLANIPEGNYLDILCQIPDDGSLVMIENSGGKNGVVLSVFLPDDFPSDQYNSKSFTPTSRNLFS